MSPGSTEHNPGPVEPRSITAYRLAERYLQIRELPGELDHPLIRWWLSLCGFGLQGHDEVAWCGAFVAGVAWLLRLPMPKFPARARYWLTVGTPVDLEQAEIGFDIVVLERGTSGVRVPASVLNAPGHVGFFAGLDGDVVHVLGGNQADRVSIVALPRAHVLGVRRLA